MQGRGTVAPMNTPSTIYGATASYFSGATEGTPLAQAFSAAPPVADQVSSSLDDPQGPDPAQLTIVCRWV